MKFLADENVERKIVEALRQWGHDVKAIYEALPGSSDDEVLNLALKENRIFLTNDLDFGKMIMQQHKPSIGIVLFRFSQEITGIKIKSLKHLLEHHSDKLENHFTVISEGQIKIRPLKS